MARLTDLLAGSLLVVAATLKVVSSTLNGAPVVYDSGSWIFTVLLVNSELLLGSWLFSRHKLNWARVVSILVFSLFALHSTVRIAEGAEYCGCFGVIQVSPKITLLLNILVVLLFGRSIFSLHAKDHNDKNIAAAKPPLLFSFDHKLFCAVFGLAIWANGMLGTRFLVANDFQNKHSDGVVRTETEIFVNPTLLNGKVFPIALLNCQEFADIFEDCLVLFHDSNCNDCKTVVQNLQPDLDCYCRANRTVVFVDVGCGSNRPVLVDDKLFLCWLADDSKTYNVPVPLLVSVKNRTVEATLQPEFQTRQSVDHVQFFQE